MSELALQLIEENKQTRNPALDLGNCGLTRVPDAIGDCAWLETLILSNKWQEYDEEQKDWVIKRSQNKDEENRLEALPARLALLKNLKKLIIGGEFRNTFPLSDLSPLSQLTQLKELDCNRTQVSDLNPLSQLIQLKLLNCAFTQVSDLSPLSQLTQLQSLDCGNTQVSDLSPLSQLTQLQSLDCDSTQVSDLSPLSQLTQLQSLYCAFTQVKKNTPAH